MLKMRADALSRKRRAMTGAAPVARGVGGGVSGQENLFAKMMRGDMEEEDYLTDDEQLDVLPG